VSGALLKHSRMPRKAGTAAGLPALEKPKAVLAPGLVGQDPKTILLRYLSDESTQTIAEDFGVTRQALGQYLLRHAEEDWKEAQVARAIARKERAEDALEAATDPLQLAKARELLKAAQWDLERVCRRIYGIDREINFNLNVGDLGDRLRRARDRANAIDVTPAPEAA
jgi:predicted DNA-binding protein YlxM (UPF0122 family)